MVLDLFPQKPHRQLVLEHKSGLTSTMTILKLYQSTRVFLRQCLQK
jgi:hypothetical protein